MMSGAPDAQKMSHSEAVIWRVIADASSWNTYGIPTAVKKSDPQQSRTADLRGCPGPWI